MKKPPSGRLFLAPMESERYTGLGNERRELHAAAEYFLGELAPQAHL